MKKERISPSTHPRFKSRNIRLKFIPSGVSYLQLKDRSFAPSKYKKGLLCMLLMMLLSCEEGKDSNSDLSISVSTDKCNLSQKITAQDPDGNTSDISDISEVTTELATSDCPKSLLNAEKIKGTVGTIKIIQTVLEQMQITYLIVDIKEANPFVISLEPFSGERSATEFTLITPFHIALGELSCKIDAVFVGKFDSSQGKIEGTLGATVHNVSKCLLELGVSSMGL